MNPGSGPDTGQYSGGSNRGAPPLWRLARQKCIENAHIIHDIGTTPYHLIEPILKRKTAKSLLLIEAQSPQIVPYSEPLWKSLIKRDFSDRPVVRSEVRNGKKGLVPARELYKKYAEEREEQRRQATETFKQITRSLTKEKRKHRLRTVDHVTLAPKRSGGGGGSGGGSGLQRPAPTFRSSLLEKARHQNRMRIRYLGEKKVPVASARSLQSREVPPARRGNIGVTGTVVGPRGIPKTVAVKPPRMMYKPGEPRIDLSEGRKPAAKKRKQAYVYESK